MTAASVKPTPVATTSAIHVMERGLWQMLLSADAIGVRLERVHGVTTWEMMPPLGHQREVDRIRSGIQARHQSSCGCFHFPDIYIQFPDGSFKRPDISLFCEDPGHSFEAITNIPEAVIEVISKGYEAKDLDIAPRFYLSQGVRDVVVFDPMSLIVLHIRKSGAKRHISPVTLELEMGCVVTV
jgi:Uma2 family endonuclease